MATLRSVQVEHADHFFFCELFFLAENQHGSTVKPVIFWSATKMIGVLDLNRPLYDGTTPFLY